MEDPGSPNAYGCVTFGLKRGKEAMIGVIGEPVKVRFEGHTAYSFVFAGMMWMFMISSHRLSAGVRQAVVQPDGSLMFLVKDGDEYVLSAVQAARRR